jgi:hypothetical protein
VEEPMSYVDLFIQGITGKNWVLLVASCLMVVVYFVRRIVAERIPAKYVPWYVLGMAVVTAVAVRLIEAVQMDQLWWASAVRGLVEGAIVGLTASGLWSAVGKFVTPEIR